MRGESRGLFTQNSYRGLEITGASEDLLVEEGRRMELFCESEEHWNVCEWTRVSDK